MTKAETTDERQIVPRENEIKRFEKLLEIQSETNLGKKGFCIALSAGYGQGKTTFIELLTDHFKKAYIKDRKFHAVKFSAWETDFAKNPLEAFIEEMKEGLPADILPVEMVLLI